MNVILDLQAMDISAQPGDNDENDFGPVSLFSVGGCTPVSFFSVGACV